MCLKKYGFVMLLMSDESELAPQILMESPENLPTDVDRGFMKTGHDKCRYVGIMVQNSSAKIACEFRPCCSNV